MSLHPNSKSEDINQEPEAEYLIPETQILRLGALDIYIYIYTYI